MRISLEVNAGELEPEQESGDRIVFLDQDERPVFSYKKLVVIDAEGAELPARMELRRDKESGDSDGDADGGSGFEVTLVARSLRIVKFVPFFQPDSRVGKSPATTVGDGIYGTAAGQTVSLLSKKARTVSTSAERQAIAFSK